MAVPPSLAELAAAQVANPANPYINPASPYAHNTPEQQAVVNAGINSPVTHARSGAVLGAEPPIQPADKLFSGGTIDDRVLDPSRNGATNAYGVRQNPDQAAAATQQPGLAGLGLTGGGGSAGSALSPERARLASDDQSRKDQAELLNSTAVIDDRNKNLMLHGEEAAQQAIAKRETQKTSDDAALAQMRTEMQKHADERTAALEKQAAETRAAKVDPQHWFKERGTVGSLLAAISIGAGAFAAAMPHTGSHQNFAMDMIDKSIGRDIQSQEENINNKWKSLNYQGDQNEKEYVKGQYTINAKRDATIAAYDHANALVSEMRNGTNNQVAISNLDKLSTELAAKKIDLTKEGAAQREAVAIKERAAAAAGAGSNPLSATNLNKAYAKYATEAASEQVKNPKAGPILSREDWFKIQQGQGHAGGSSGQPDKQKDAANSADEFIAAVDRVNKILEDPMYANSPKGRAELDQQQRNLTLAYPKSQTGSTRINEAELKIAGQTFEGLGGTIRSDMLGRTRTTLGVLRGQAQTRKKQILAGGGGDDGVPGATPVGE